MTSKKSLLTCRLALSLVLNEIGSVCTNLFSVSLPNSVISKGRTAIFTATHFFSVSCALFACSLALAMRVSIT